MSALSEVVAQAFGVEPDGIDESSSPETVEGWDSMGHLNLIAALEKRFNISIDIGEMKVSAKREIAKERAMAS